MKKFSLLFIILITSSIGLLAGGYQVRLQGARQSGMGLTGTSLISGASDIFYNPGSLSFLSKKFEFTAGTNAIFSKIEFRSLESDYVAKTNNPVSLPFFFYGAGKITDKITAGLGIYTPYGSKTDWPDDWSGRFLIQNIALSSIYFQPSISFQILDNLSIGAGLAYVMGSVDLQRALPYNDRSFVKLNGNASAFGFNIGVLFKPAESMHIGIDYRSKIEVKLDDGDANFRIPASLVSIITIENKFSSSLPLPANLDCGLSWQITQKLLFSFEINWVLWNCYDSLTFTFIENGDMLNSINPLLYSNSIIPRFGLEYRIQPKLKIRTGAYYDNSPANDEYFTPETVTLNTLGFTFGLSYHPIENLNFDFSFVQLMGIEGEKKYSPGNFAGKYRSSASIPGIGISYSF